MCLRRAPNTGEATGACRAHDNRNVADATDCAIYSMLVPRKNKGCTQAISSSLHLAHTFRSLTIPLSSQLSHTRPQRRLKRGEERRNSMCLKLKGRKNPSFLMMAACPTCSRYCLDSSLLLTTGLPFYFAPYLSFSPHPSTRSQAVYRGLELVTRLRTALNS